MSTDPRPATEAGEPAATATAPTGRPSRRNRILLLIAAVIALDVVASIVVPPFPLGEPDKPISGIGDLIMANLEFPAPHVVWSPSGEVHELPLISFDVSLSNTLLTMWIVMGLLLLVFIVAGRMVKEVPGRLQNAVEFIWESLENWAVSLGGPDARRHIPLFAAFFLFILVSNWSGLLPFFGKIEALRAPTSDVNVTIGLALVSFLYFEFQGFKKLGVGGYLGKFFPFYEFRKGIGAGGIALFVGLVELMLEFVKPVTLSMRLFGNIYGGEVALGVITALTIAFIPVGLLGLEVMLNAIQALIFSVLTLIFITLAIESHEHEEGHLADEAVASLHEPEGSALQPAH